MKITWDLESLFPGGSQSAEFREHLSALLDNLDKLKTLTQSSATLKEAILLSEEVFAALSEAGSFVACLLAQDVSDQGAKQLQSSLTSLEASFEQCNTDIDQLLVSCPDFDALLQDADLQKRAFPLKELRELAALRLSPDKENIISDLAIDGYHGWCQLYEGTIGRLTFPFRGENLYAGQIENKFSDLDRKTRSEAFAIYSDVFEKNEELFASILNHIGGFRLKMYEQRGWESVHKEPLFYNRMSEKTLSSMWSAVKTAHPLLSKFMERKAKLLGIEKLGWEDLEAPLGESQKHIPYNEGAQFIIDQFAKFSPKMAAFSKMALDKGWVEAEDRPGKRPGGFCTNLTQSKETRIFMTYSGTMTNVTTLAHELGHAFHADCVFDLPILAQHYRMNVAETASTMAEMIVADAAYESATDAQEKLILLDEKIARSVAFLMNLYTRFIFETRFYEKRGAGFLLPNELNSLMEEAQKEAYAGSLSHYHPRFWASKGHFYFTDVPFYNFPYTFGHLFSLGIYLKLKEDMATFEEKYIALLRDSAQMTTEELAQKHLGIDLETPDFWQMAIDHTLRDVEEFLEMTK